MKMIIKVYECLDDFNYRPLSEKDYNGVSTEFIQKHANWREMNETNKGCYDCANCSNCVDCDYCVDCHDCDGCSNCKKCCHADGWQDSRDWSAPLDYDDANTHCPY